MKRIHVNEEYCIACRLCEIHCLVQHSQSRKIIKAFKEETPRAMARLLVEEAERLARRSGREHMLAMTLNVRALVEQHDDHHRAALRYADRALDVASRLPTPRVRGLIVRKTQVSMTSTALVTWREHVVTEAVEAGVMRYYGGSQAEPAQYIYANGSRVMLGGMDNPTKIMSSDYDLIYVQEAIELTEGDWDALSSRLRNGALTYQQLYGDTNPDAPTHWLRQRADQGQLVMLESRHSDNPVLTEEDGTPTGRGKAYLDRLDRLAGVRKARLRDGLWVAAEGVIYDDYDPAVHLIDRFPIPDSWPRYWAVDFGFVHPFVLQCWAADEDGRLYLYREIYATHRRVDQHARDILYAVTEPASRVDAHGHEIFSEYWKWTEPKPEAIICDHDAESRATLEDQLRLSTTAANKAVEDGIQAVQRRLVKQKDGRPRIFFMRDSVMVRDPELVEARKPTCTVEEITGYVWDMTQGKRPKESPVKIHDDGMDTMRYMVMSDMGWVPGVWWM